MRDNLSKRFFALQKKFLSIVLTIIMIVGMIPIVSLPASASATYDANAALSYAANHWNDGIGKCAEFVSKCINAGGCSAYDTGATSLMRKLKETDMGTVYELPMEFSGNYVYVNLTNYSNVVSSGDPVFYYCSSCNDGKAYNIHVVLCNGKDSNGYMKAYSHNNANSGTSKYAYGRYCYDCNSEIDAIYVYHFNGNIKRSTKLSKLMEMFPDGSYWNGGNPDKVTPYPCQCKHTSSHKNGSSSVPCECNEYEGAIQCHGFVKKLSDLYYGSDIMDWEQQRNLDSLKPGDGIRYMSDGHTIWVTGVSGNDITYAQCNIGGSCLISWNNKTTKSNILNSGFTKVYSAPYALEGGTTPIPPSTPDYHECGNCVSVNKDGWVTNVSTVLNVRSGPGTSYEKLFELQNNASLKISAECSGWYFVTASDGRAGWVSADYVEINSQETHSHNYTDWNYEAAHPHREYKTCSCGAYQYTGENYFDEAHYISYYAAHPHYEVKVCNICGWDQVEKTGGTRYVDSCITCNPPTASVPTLNSVSASGQSVTLKWSSAANASSYDVYLVQSPWGWEDIKYSKTGVTSTSYTFAGVAFGYYKAFVIARPQSDNKKQSNWIAVEVKVPSYTVKFNGNGATSGSMANKVYNVGESKNLPANSFTRTGYSFSLWSTICFSSYQEADEYLLDNGLSSVDILFDEELIRNLALAGETITLYAIWQANTYAVKYNANGGIGSMSNSSHTYDTSKALSANAFTRTGYTFLGWSKDKNATSATYTNSQSVENLTSVNGDTVTLYAVWKPNTYTIKYNANGGSGTMANSSHTYNTAKALTANTFTRTGYTFLGWSKDKNATSATYTNSQSVKNLTSVNGDTVTLYAVWQVSTYTVKYNANGGSGSMPDTIVQSNTETYLSANGFTKTGYRFSLWSTVKFDTYEEADEYGKKHGLDVFHVDDAPIFGHLADPGEIITLYAVWKPISYTIKYNANGGSGSMSSSTHTYDTAKALSANTFTRSEYTFLGWSKDASATSVTYTDGQSVKNLTSVNGDTVTLYAVWSEIPKYTVSYNANGGTDAPDNQIKTHDIALTLTSLQPTRTGYAFKGWTTSSSGSVVYAAGATYADNSNVTLYAVWQANTYTVKYNSNGGSGTMSNSSHTYDSSKALNANAFARTGYTFLGWSNDKNAISATYTNSQSVKNLTAVNGDTVTLYAVWHAISYQIVYDGNGATSGTPTSTNHMYDVEKNLQKNTFRKVGYCFLGWSKDRESQSAEYIDEQVVKNLSSKLGDVIYLYAIWSEAPKYIISYDANGGIGKPASQSKIYDEKLLLSDIVPMKQGYLFLYWSGSDGWLYNPASEYRTNSSVTMTAVWKPITYTIKYNANGGSGSVLSSTHTYDNAKELSSNTFARSGYTFLGWSTDPSATSAVYTDKQSVKNLTSTNNGSVTLYAVWKEENQETYQIDIWVANGEDIDEIVLTKKKGDIINLSDYKPKQTGYTFIAWVDLSTNESYSANDKFIVTQDTLLVSGMQANTYIVYFDSVGGIVTEDLKSVKYDSTYNQLPTPTKNGYTFKGWFTGQNGGERITADTVVKTPENHTIYAHWSQDVQIISPSAVSLNKTSTTLRAGDTETLIATVLPADATNKNVTWTSSNTSVATVSSSGVVTAKAAGTVTITATAGDGGKTATCTVNVTAPSEDVSFNIHAENASGRPGNSVTVPVKIENNPGIAVLSFGVKYNSDAMTLTGCSVGDVFEAGDIMSGNIDKNPYTFFALCGTENRNGNGTVAYFTFEIADGCQAGEYDIEIIPLESYTIEEAALTFGTQNGTVTVRDFICGDATGDGTLNRQDLLRLAKAFAGWDVEYDEAASDVTGDGTVNRQDLLRLAKYFAGWDVTLG